MTTSVIVLSYRPGDWLAPCLASVIGQADEVIVVDNGSPDRQASDIARRAGATVVTSATNLGFAGGVNLGARRARGSHLALLNDDATAEPGWLSAATAVLEDRTVAAVTPKVRLAGWWRQIVFDDAEWFAPGDTRPLGRQVRSVITGGVDVLAGVVGAGIHQLEQAQDSTGGPDERWRWSAGGRPFYVPLGDRSDEVEVNGVPAPPGPTCRLINNAGSVLRGDGYIGDYGLETPDDGRFDSPGERFAASGAALVTRASTFARLGGLAQPFFAYYEDSDWSWRARLAGLRMYYDPSSVVEHRRSATSGGVTDPWVHLLAERNRLLTAVRNAPASVATRLVARRVAEGPQHGIRRAMLRRLPWALATRTALSRGWVRRPEEVWRRWAGADVTWDQGPVGSPSRGGSRW
jgi:GT2 family glycosyltransferase